MNITIDQVWTFKLNSGEEVIAKVKEVNGTEITITEPVSIAPGPQGMGLVPSMFTAEPSAEVILNTNSVSLCAPTDENVRLKYLEATTGIKVPERKLILG